MAEVLSEEKCRLSLSGWFHGPSLPRPSRYIEPPVPRHTHIPRDVSQVGVRVVRAWPCDQNSPVFMCYRRVCYLSGWMRCIWIHAIRLGYSRNSKRIQRFACLVSYRLVIIVIINCTKMLNYFECPVVHIQIYISVWWCTVTCLGIVCVYIKKTIYIYSYLFIRLFLSVLLWRSMYNWWKGEIPVDVKFSDIPLEACRQVSFK